MSLAMSASKLPSRPRTPCVHACSGDVAWNASSAPRFADESPADRRNHRSVVRDACLCRLAIDVGDREPIDRFRIAQLTDRPDVEQPQKSPDSDPSFAHRHSPGHPARFVSTHTYFPPAGAASRHFAHFSETGILERATAAIRTARPSIPTADLADAQQSLAMPVGTYLPSTHGRSFRRGPLRLSTDVMLISRACLTPFCMFFVKPAVRSAATAAIRSAGASIQPADFADAEQTLAMPVGSIHPPFMVIPPDLAQSASLKTTFRPCRCCHTIASGHTRSRYVRVI